MASKLGHGARDRALAGVTHVLLDAGGALLSSSPGATEIFLRALARAATTPERILMVGDSHEADYLGVRHAGLHALLLRRRAEAPNRCPSIRSLEELPALVQSGRSRD